METTRPWQVIADEMTKERDPERMLALAEELNRTLAEQQGHGGRPERLPVPSKQQRDRNQREQ